MTRTVPAWRIWLPPLLQLAPLAWLFRKALFQSELFAFRDAAHYYFPLYRYVQDQWRDGLPLWNSLDALGQPLLGDPTAAVLYPGKLIFLLPCSYATCFAWYVVLHLWLAGWGAYSLARGRRGNWFGCVLAGWAYGLSGQVLFQYCNPIYCVGAAWLPWAVMYLFRWLQFRQPTALLLLGVILSLMVLGGDPHAAYYVFLLGLLWIAVALGISSPRATAVALLQLATVAIVVMLLAAAQWVPTHEWVQRSDRGLRDGPRSLYELSSDVLTAANGSGGLPSLDAFWTRSDRYSHDHRAYDFSVGCWRWAECVWPNVSGSPFPRHQRWLAAFPGESRTWTPSLYLGLFPIALAIRRMRWRQGKVATRFWSWAVLITMLGAMGSYGLGWLWNEFQYWMDPSDFRQSNTLPGVGGVYWLMNVVLPGHVGFRYPAKLWTVTSLGMAMLASQGWPAWRVSRRRRIPRPWLALVLASVVLACIAGLPFCERALAQVPASAIFGPLDIESTQVSLCMTFLHTALVATVLLFVSRCIRPSWASWGLVLVTLVELTIAQMHLVQTVPSVPYPNPRFQAHVDVIYRSRPLAAYPRDWKLTTSARRFEELQAHDVQTVMPKHHLALGTRSILSSVSMASADTFALMEVARELGYETAGPYRVPHRAWANLLGATVLLTSEKGFLSESELANSDDVGGLLQVSNSEAYPRAWLVHDWETRSSPSLDTYQELLAHTRDVVLDAGRFRDFRRVAVVESPPSGMAEPTAAASGGRCEWEYVSNHVIRVQASTSAPAILVLSEQYYPGWEVWVKTAGTWTRRPLLRVNRVMQGVSLEAGDHQIEFRYRPRLAWVGVAVSLVSWALLLGLGLWTTLAPGRRRTGEDARLAETTRQ